MLGFIKETNKIIFFKKIYLTEEKKLKKKKNKFAVIAFIDHERIRNIPEFVKHHSKGGVQSYDDK